MKEEKIVRMDFPSNNHKTQKKKTDSTQEKKAISKITSGKVVQKKKTLGKKFSETFLGDSMESVSSYIINDVIVPTAKDLLYDIVTDSLGISLYGKAKSGRSKIGKSGSRFNYNKVSYKQETTSPRMTSRNRATHNFDDIVLESRVEAEEVISHLVDLIENYGMTSVADLYDLVGITSNFTDNKYGWDNLSSASVSRTREGYLLNLPKTIVLD